VDNEHHQEANPSPDDGENAGGLLAAFEQLDVDNEHHQEANPSPDDGENAGGLLAACEQLEVDNEHHQEANPSPDDGENAGGLLAAFEQLDVDDGHRLPENIMELARALNSMGDQRIQDFVRTHHTIKLLNSEINTTTVLSRVQGNGQEVRFWRTEGATFPS
jgi:hypothetical protein